MSWVSEGTRHALPLTKIRELIANLDQRKNDAIQTTFKARVRVSGFRG